MILEKLRGKGQLLLVGPLSYYSNVTSTCTISHLLPSRSGGPQNPKPEETIAWNAPFVRSPSLVRTFFSLQYDLVPFVPVRVTG